MVHPVTLAALGAAALVLALSGPFGTRGQMALPGRLAYWAAVVGATYGAGALVRTALSPRALGWPLWRDVLVTGLAGGGVVVAVVLALNRAVFGGLPAGLAGFVVTVMAITAAITAVFALHERRAATATATAAPAVRPPAILARLPLSARGPLVALSVEDHYVRIRTLKGEEMVLMRLSDAIAEVGDTPGARVHRSHWVAFDKVRAARRDGDRAVLTMVTGPDIPVSRANLPKLKEAGLLPR